MAPFPPIERWLIPQAVCEQTRKAVLPAGRRGTESGVFWLGTRATTSVVHVVAMPIGQGVVELSWQWRVSPELYAAVATYAKPRGLSLLAVVHTHLSGRAPRLSRTDRMKGLKVQDALAVIVGSGGEERDPARWGWFVYDSGDYRDLSPDERAARLEMTDAEAEFVELGLEASS
jgi:proteasome lid subunit RPN8/RPN11